MAATGTEHEREDVSSSRLHTDRPLWVSNAANQALSYLVVSDSDKAQRPAVKHRGVERERGPVLRQTTLLSQILL